MSVADDLVLPGAHSIPGLLSGAAVVALVPATAELGLAAAAAWHIARVAAARGRRVALVDCYVDEPQLADGQADTEGIVDVFEYGASFSRIARPQAPNLYFIPAGTFAPDPAAMMAHARWRRLAAGFRHEDAVMLLFLPPECLAVMAPNLDGMVALAPGGADAGLASTPEIEAAADRGVRLLAVMTDDSGAEAPELEAGPPDEEGAAPPPAATPPRVEARPVARAETRDAVAGFEAEAATPAERGLLRRRGLGEGGERAPRRRRTRVLLYGVGLIVVAAEAAAIFREPLRLRLLGRSTSLAQPRSATARFAPGYRQLEPRAADSLPYAVQVSSWTSLVFAADAAGALEERGVPAIVAPLRLGGRIWYRVLAGPVATQDLADSLLSVLREAGFDRPRTAQPVLAPLSVALQRFATLAAARGGRARALAAGLPTFVLGQADGSYRLYAGAFATPAEAAYLDSLVTSTGSAGPLGSRVGFRP